MDFRAFFDDPLGKALYATLVFAFADWAFGVFAALRDGTFAMDAIGAFIRKHLMGRVAPIALGLIMGYYSHQSIIAGAALAAAALYLAETAASIKGSLAPPAASVEAEMSPAELVNPVPVD